MFYFYIHSYLFHRILTVDPDTHATRVSDFWASAFFFVIAFFLIIFHLWMFSLSDWRKRPENRFPFLKKRQWLYLLLLGLVFWPFFAIPSLWALIVFSVGITFWGIVVLFYFMTIRTLPK